MKGKTGLTVLVVGLAALLAACRGAPAPTPAPGPAVKPGWEQEWERVLAAAKQEGRVVVFARAGDLLRKNITEGFKKAFREL